MPWNRPGTCPVSSVSPANSPSGATRSTWRTDSHTVNEVQEQKPTTVIKVVKKKLYKQNKHLCYSLRLLHHVWVHLPRLWLPHRGGGQVPGCFRSHLARHLLCVCGRCRRQLHSQQGLKIRQHSVNNNTALSLFLSPQVCSTSLEGQAFFSKKDKPLCKKHAHTVNIWAAPPWMWMGKGQQCRFTAVYTSVRCYIFFRITFRTNIGSKVPL